MKLTELNSLLAPLMAGIIFIIGILVPLSFVISVFYIIPLLVISESHKSKRIWLTTLLCIVLIIIGIFLSPTPSIAPYPYTALINRFMAIAALLIVTILLLQKNRAMAELERYRASLEGRNADLASAANALRKSEERLRLAQINASVGVWDWNPRTGEENFTPELDQLYGLAPGAVRTYQDWRQRVHPDDIARIEAEQAEALANRKPFDLELRIIHSSDEVRWISTKGGAVYNDDGEVARVLGINMDITERKRMEDELHKSKDELEQRVAERTADLSHAKKELETINKELHAEIEEQKKIKKDLLIAKDAAEAAAVAKAQFMANMSHEIRTPMNAVIGMTSLLLGDESLTPEQKDFIETIRNSGDALMSIINDVLDISKMEGDKVVLEEQPFELRNCAEEALGLVTAKAAEKGLNLAYVIDENVPDTIIGDPSRLRQILANLLSNAVKFTEEGEVKLSISSQKLDKIDELHFSIQDTGIGISQDRMDRLFQPFSQMEPSTNRLYGGTGLGLAISKRLVELMGGRIWAESDVGKGSIFHFTIKAETAPSKQKDLLVGAQPQLVGKSILIVEDNKTNRRILGGYTYSRGMVPMTAASAQEALGWIQKGDNYDIAILDWNMLNMDGLALAEEIRKYNKTLPLVILTSIGQRVPINHAYLTKPIKPSQLHKVLTSILSRQICEPDRTPAVKKTQDGSLKILLAEDNVSSQQVALHMLKRLGYRADAVANGIEALQALERQPYDIVLIDVCMPEMDGLQATRIIRQRCPDNGPKVIAITAYALEGDREKCLEAGMDDYISKPVKMEELARVLSKYQPG